MKFLRGDPGKRVDAVLSTPEWKKLRVAAQRQGITLGRAAQLALVEWSERHGA